MPLKPLQFPDQLLHDIPNHVNTRLTGARLVVVVVVGMLVVQVPFLSHHLPFLSHHPPLPSMFAHPMLAGLSAPADAVAQALSFRVARCTRGSYDHICPWWEWPTLHAIVPWASNSKLISILNLQSHDTTCHTKRWLYTPLLNNTWKNPGLVYSGITLGQCATSIQKYRMIPENIDPGTFWSTPTWNCCSRSEPFAPAPQPQVFACGFSQHQA